MNRDDVRTIRMSTSRHAVSKRWRRCVAILLVGIFLIVSLVGPVQGTDPVPRLVTEPGQVVQTAVHPFADPEPRVQTERLPLLEVFTATWCPPCAPADRAIERLLDERSPALAKGGDPVNDSLDLAVLAYHPWPDVGGEDPFGIPEGQERLSAKHNSFWFPSVYVDGFLEDAPETRSRQVDAGMEEVFHDSYRGLLQRAGALPPGFTVTTEWSGDAANLTVQVHLEATADTRGPFYVRGVLWEDHLRFPGSNGIEEHRMTVRALTAQSVVQDLAPGARWETEWEVRVPEGGDLSRAGMTIIVETAWGGTEGDQAGLVMGYAVGVAGVAVVAVLFLRRQGRRPSTASKQKEAGTGERATGRSEEAVG